MQSVAIESDRIATGKGGSVQVHVLRSLVHAKTFRTRRGISEGMVSSILTTTFECQFRLGSPTLDGIQARRGDSQPANDLLTLGQPWRNRQGLCRPGCLSRDCWYEYGDDGAGGGTFRLQFAPAAFSDCSHGADGYL